MRPSLVAMSPVRIVTPVTTTVHICIMRRDDGI
jgi:hypothetical protein